MTANDKFDRRLATITLKVLAADKRDRIKIAKRYGATAFEARYIDLACEWSNDLLVLCFETLRTPDFKKHWANSRTHDEWYEWFVKTVDALEVK